MGSVQTLNANLIIFITLVNSTTRRGLPWGSCWCCSPPPRFSPRSSSSSSSRCPQGRQSWSCHAWSIGGLVMVVLVIVMKCCHLASLKVDKVGLSMLCKLRWETRFTSKVKWRYLGHELVICSEQGWQSYNNQSILTKTIYFILLCKLVTGRSESMVVNQNKLLY